VGERRDSYRIPNVERERGPDPREAVAFAPERIVSRRRVSLLGPTIGLAGLFLAVAGIGWLNRPPDAPQAPPTTAATTSFAAEPIPTPTLRAMPAAREAVDPADSPVLGGLHPDREHGTDGLLGGIVFAQDD